MKITVAIPVYNEEKYIEECLNSIVNNTRVPDEIIVADGLSEDRTKERVSRFPQVKLLTNTKRTAASGRNLAISEASGDIIIFTDGDCCADSKWIENIEKAFERYHPDALGGKVAPATAENRYEEFWNRLAWNTLMSFGDKGYKVVDRTMNDAFVTANCAYRKDLLNELAGFDEWFGNNAEDVDLSWRALASGADMRYIPEAVIYAHGVTTLKGIRKKSFRNGISSSKIQKRYGSRLNYDWNIYKLWRKQIPGCLRKDFNSMLLFNELSWHLLGKYYGSIKYRVINL